MAAKDYIRRNWNLPNALTLLRLLLVPVYVILFAYGRRYQALFVFLLACLTDLLDGQIARRCGLITDFGKLMDPLADKIMVVTAMVSMAMGNLPRIAPVIPWVAVLIVLLKEAIMIVGGFVMYRHGIVVFSSLIGKIAHCVFVFGLIATYFHEALVAALPDWGMTPDLILIWLAVVLTLCALSYYVVSAIQKAKEHGIIGNKKQKEKTLK